MSASESSDSSPVRRVRHELVRRDLRVARTERASPGFMTVVLAGAALDGFISQGFDDHVKLFLHGPDGQEFRRDYTPRRFDAGRRELTLEFALHEGGQAADWALAARAGDAAHIGGPRGSMIVRDDLDGYLLVGDATALPAIARRLEELPAGARATALIRIDHPQDERALPSKAACEVRWFTSDEAWLDALRSTPLPPATGFVWAAGEASVMVKVRDFVLQERGYPRDHTCIAAYWKRGASAFREDL